MPWPPKYIALAGAELEGGWLQEPDTGTYHHDGSVLVRAPIVGEFVSQPLPPVELVDWVKDPKVYPPFINSSCGLHVHMSFKDNNNYVRVMTQEYFDAFGLAMKKLGTDLGLPETDSFWSRLNGRNQYCRKEFVPGLQWTDRGKSERRYTQLNYCYGLRGTMECRLFPMFRSRNTAGNAIKGLLQFTDDWLRETRPRRQEKEEIRIQFSDEEPEPDVVIADPASTQRVRVSEPDANHVVMTTPVQSWTTTVMNSGTGNPYISVGELYSSLGLAVPRRP